MLIKKEKMKQFLYRINVKKYSAWLLHNLLQLLLVMWHVRWLMIYWGNVFWCDVIVTTINNNLGEWEMSRSTAVRRRVGSGNKKLFVASPRSQEGPLEHRESLETSQQSLCSIMLAREIQKYQQWIENLSIIYTEKTLFPHVANFYIVGFFECDSSELIITVSLKVVFQIVSACQHLLNSRFVSFTFDYLTIFHHYQAGYFKVITRSSRLETLLETEILA